ncbi:carboxymuconolactone decarboxylase family protein [Kitasatospora xanthocidica]|uniref:Carboxymuconolactone decarboxylase family protein n=1 Tax=Kitasatospora xanthocidica TaxID=83382 RepID=A0A372ZKC8_9ACTN|nr:carboxymuconolactone decarboxylase family protein [Kitasatospora xanthocidica]RGD56303.1 carboxymuconolactone decarboxylase family protein [Kitasatospora xanthocidica]
MSPATAPAGPDLTPAPLDRAAGHALLADLAGPGAASTLGGLDALAPGFPDWIVTSLFGGTYQRPGLALRDRQIANLAALTALGGVEPQLADHVRYSRRIGLTEAEITEVMVHLAPYVGLPKALAGLRVATATFAESTESTDSTESAESAEATKAAEGAAGTVTEEAGA